MRIKTHPFKDTWFIPFFILGTMNFFANGNLIFLIFAVCSIFLNKISIKRNDWDFLFISVLTLAIFFVSLTYWGFSSAIKSLSFLFLYIFGYSKYKTSKNKTLFFKRVIYSVFAGSFLFTLLEVIFNMHQQFTSVRIMKSIWTGDYISVTLIALISSLAIGVSICNLFFTNNRLIKILSALALLVTVIINFNTATRSPFVIIIILLALSIFISQNNRSRKIKQLTILFGVLLVAVLLYVTDTFGIKTYFAESEIYRRVFLGQSNSAGRGEIMLKHLQYAFAYPWGGNIIRTKVGSFGHNWIQDCHDSYGIIASSMCLFLTLSVFKKIKKLICQKNKGEDAYLMLFMLLTMSLEIVIEPVFNAYPIYIYILFCIMGICNAYLENSSK